MTDLKHLVLIYGGTSVEHHISRLSARWVLENTPSDYQCQPVLVDRNSQWWLTPGIIDEDPNHSTSRKINGLTECSECFGPGENTVYFIAIHGTGGEDGHLQGALTTLNLPYTGCDTLSSAVSMDKEFSKILVQSAGLQVAKGVSTTEVLGSLPPELEYPVFIKPARLGSSVGVSQATSDKQLSEALQEALTFDTKALVEETIHGREVECAVLETEQTLEVSIPGEVVTSHSFYSYEAKYVDKQATRTQIPADFPPDLLEKIKGKALIAANALGAEGFCRIDFFVRNDNQEPVFNEVNTIPGLTEYSLFPGLWQYEGKSASTVISHIIQAGLKRWHKQQTLKRSLQEG